MYLDTDIILAVAKEKDWLKQSIKPSSIQNQKTSTFTVIEARLVLQREYSRDSMFLLEKVIKKYKIKILSVDDRVIEKSEILLKKYEQLGIFDSVHIACALVHKESIMSTDRFFDKVIEIKRIDPRTFK